MNCISLSEEAYYWPYTPVEITTVTIKSPPFPSLQLVEPSETSHKTDYCY